MIVCRILEIIFDLGFSEGEFFAPYVFIRISVVVNRLQIGGNEHSLEPMQIFAVVEVADFGFIHIEGRNGDAVGIVIPIVHHILLHPSEDESTAFNEHEAGAGCLFHKGIDFKAAVLRIVVFPTGGMGVLFLAGAEQKCDCGNQQQT